MKRSIFWHSVIYSDFYGQPSSWRKPTR